MCALYPRCETRKSTIGADSHDFQGAANQRRRIACQPVSPQSFAIEQILELLEAALEEIGVALLILLLLDLGELLQ